MTDADDTNTVRMRVDVLVHEDVIAEVMRRRRCNRRDAIAHVRDAWQAEVDLQHPVILWPDDATAEIGFDSGPP